MAIRVLVLGTGSIGRRHIANLKLLTSAPRFLLVRQDARRDAYSDEIGADVFGDIDAALAAKPDIAVIATPSTSHCEPLIALLRAGIATYVEKPVVASRAQLDLLLAAMESLPSLPPVVIGCNLRFLPSLLHLRALLVDGAIGKPVRAYLQVGQWLPDWRPQQDYRQSYSARPDQGGGVVLDLIHELDMARFLFGEFSRVQAAGGRYSALEIESEDAATILLSRPTGPVVAVGLDYVSRRPVRHYEIVGDTGTLIWDLRAKRITIHRAGGVEDVPCGEEDFDMQETYRAAMRRLLDMRADAPSDDRALLQALGSVALALQANEAIRA